MKKAFLLVTAALVFTMHAIAQTNEYLPFDHNIAKDFSWDEFIPQEFSMNSYDRDPAAQAVVLKEYGKAWITSNGNNTTLMFEYHVKIKIFDSRAFNKGHIEIPFYIQDNGTYEEVRLSNIQGVTHYKKQDGSMQSADLSPDSISTIRINKHWSKIVFNLPAINKGCIIEYRYQLESPFIDKLRTWEFQSDIPKVFSEYEVHIPSVFGYNISFRGNLKLAKDTVAIEKNCFESTNLKSDCGVEDYEINDIPAFKPEPYLSSPKNFMSALYFQVTQSTQLNNYTTLNQAVQEDVAADWSQVDRTLRYNDNFGSQLNHRSYFNDKIAKVIAGKTDTLEKAKAVYAFIQQSIRFDGLNSIYTDNGIKKAFEKHAGNAADINLALVAALKEAGINADAVIISTRGNGMVTNLYPALTEFNYVIAIARINGRVWFSDATDPLLPFGVLPLKCLNGQGRLIPVDKPSYWVNVITPQQNTVSTTLDLTLDNNGKLTGTITSYKKSYAAYTGRNELSNYKIQNKQSATVPGFNILNAENTSADNVNAPLTQVYQVEVTNQDKSGGQFSFMPFMLAKPPVSPYELLDTLTTNPFTAATRSYPIDFGMPAACSFNLTLHLPAGYAISTSPQAVTDSLAAGAGLNSAFTNDNSTATYSLTYQLDKPVYNQGDYQGLKTLFDKILLAEKAVITVKKQ